MPFTAADASELSALKLRHYEVDLIEKSISVCIPRLDMNASAAGSPLELTAAC